MQRIIRRTLPGFSTIAVGGLLLAGCTAEGDVTDGGEDPVTVVATTTQIGSIAQDITTCAGGETQVLMSAGDDPHQFEASSAQIADMVTADLVITNGLGLESSMQRSIDNAIADGAHVMELAPQLDPLPMGEDHHHDHDHEHDHEHGAYDAHIWMDVSRMADGAELIGQELANVTSQAVYEDCGVTVAAELRAVDAQMLEVLSDMDSVALVTDHAAYGYFADRYGVEIRGVVIPGGSTDGEPSSQDLVELTKLLNDEDADALVTAKTNNNRMIAALADETDHRVPVIELYESAIGEPGSEADTYQEAMLYNAQALAEALD